MWRCVRSEDHLILECHNIKHPLLSPAQSTKQYSESRVTVILTRIQCELVWCLLRQPASDGVMSQILVTSPDVICCHNVAIQSHSRVEHQHEHTSGESELNYTSRLKIVMMEHNWHLPTSPRQQQDAANCESFSGQRPLLGRLYLVPNQEIVQEQFADFRWEPNQNNQISWCKQNLFVLEVQVETTVLRRI